MARDIGVDRITVEIDYPHSDTTWPRAPERLMSDFAGTELTDDEIDRMTHLNAMREFSYDPFRYRPREQCTVGALRAEAIGVDIEPRSSARRPKIEREGPVKMTDFSPTA
jgi:hypothetical protein